MPKSRSASRQSVEFLWRGANESDQQSGFALFIFKASSFFKEREKSGTSAFDGFKAKGNITKMDRSGNVRDFG